MADFDPADHARATGGLDENNQRTDQSPTARQRLGRFTVVCLILNRTIGRFHSDTASPKTHTLLLGSGIFVTPIKVFNGTGSVGASLLFWTFGGLVATCGLLVWLELGLSVPFRIVETVPGTFERRSVPRSGGEKNYVR